MKPRTMVLSAVALFSVSVYLGNASWLAEPPAGERWLIAHRALGQPFDRSNLTADTCTAARMVPSGHPYLENTIESMEAAFRYGAEVVELDVHGTTDGHFAVFHDWTLECRTDGRGRTRDQTIAHLKTLDIGHGYTADGGRTWPFRGRGNGQMPTLSDVLTRFPHRHFLVDFKGNDPEEGKRLANLVRSLGDKRSGHILATGGPGPVAELAAALPGTRTVVRPRLKQCLLRYIAWGWAGHVPASCEGMLVTIPVNVAPWLWGWPNRFVRRMQSVDTDVVLIGPWGGEGFSSGIDDPDDLARIHPDYRGGIWTNRIDLLGPVVSR